MSVMEYLISPFYVDPCGCWFFSSDVRIGSISRLNWKDRWARRLIKATRCQASKGKKWLKMDHSCIPLLRIPTGIGTSINIKRGRYFTRYAFYAIGKIVSFIKPIFITKWQIIWRYLYPEPNQSKFGFRNNKVHIRRREALFNYCHVSKRNICL